jgi:pimeloyl-ACP methyl ester carboxylesterase
MIEADIEIDGLQTRFFEEGRGPGILLVHGGTLGFSGAMWRLNMAPIARQGFRVLAYDQPGFGQSAPPPNFSVGYRQRFMVRLLEKLEMERPVLVGHSQGGQLVVGAAIANPGAYAGVISLGTGSLLPPTVSEKKETDSILAVDEPSIEDVKRLLEANLQNHKIITDELLAQYYEGCTGTNFEHAKARAKSSGAASSAPLWQRLDDMTTQSKFIYGRQDRGSTAERVQIAKQRYPDLDFELLENCRHILQWDQPQLVEDRIASFARLANS